MTTDIKNAILGLVFIVLVSGAIVYSVNYPVADDFIEVTARFENVLGINEGSDVYIAGIKSGRVQKLTLEQPQWSALATLKITKDIPIPSDSSVRILSNGLFGGKYVAIDIGGNFDFLVDQDQFVYTQPSIDLVDIVDRIVRNAESKHK